MSSLPNFATGGDAVLGPTADVAVGESPSFPADGRRSQSEPLAAAASGDDGARAQIVMSPYYGEPDFSALANGAFDAAEVDPVSVADLLRNGFVYAPHSIFERVKLVTFGFDPQQDMHATPEFRFLFRDSGRRHTRNDASQDWVETYHGLLCEAFASTCDAMRSPWLLQSGGKDSTPLAIAAAEVRQDTACITYLGGSEENEVASASLVARKLGLRHEALVCDPGRAYDRYLDIVGRMPLLTADFALLSYVDLAAAIVAEGGDGVVDGMGADNYFGLSVPGRHRALSSLARGFRLPRGATELPLLGRNFEFCYLMSTLQMDRIERVFPGSRFTDAEVDALFGREIADRSRNRLAPYRPEIASATSIDEHWAMAGSIAGVAGAFAKGIYTTHALSLRLAYPFCDRRLREWVYREVPSDQLVDPVTRANKVLVRRHIATRFGELPYVARKGSFRFDLVGLARERFDQVHAYAAQARDMLPGATAWLERNRSRLGNKYHASKFYLLAVVLPWLVHHGRARETRAQPAVRRVQIAMTPYHGRPDFAALPAGPRPAIDAVSVADLLRNAFVYPPHSIYGDVKLATFCFDAGQDLRRSPRVRFGFRDDRERNVETDPAEDPVDSYHRLLCDAVTASTADIASPWLLQSGGKDSTTLAIAVAQARPDTTCMTYLGGREENEVASARAVAKTLGLRHEVLVCDPGRAYDRYLALMGDMPLLTADFALLSYADMSTAIKAAGGDGVIDGMGSDPYFGMPISPRQKLLSRLSRSMRLPRWISELPLVDRSFEASYMLATLQMDPIERMFPGSRFTDVEVDALFGRRVSVESRQRLVPFATEMATAASEDEWRAMVAGISSDAASFAKGMYTGTALSLGVAYPFCDRRLREWVYHCVPQDQLVDPQTGANKVLVRRHIATRFGELPYVSKKGSFRFDVVGLARERFDQVHAYAMQARDLLPGAPAWLERNRGRLGNKYHASKFYLLAVVLPWIGGRARDGYNDESAR